MKPYKFYRFTDQDPLIKETLALIDESFAATSRATGVSASTLSNWKKKRTKRAFNPTLQAIGRSRGYRLQWVRSNGK